MIRETQSKPWLRYLFSFLLILLFVGTASAQSIVSTEYGNGWQKITYSNGISAFSNHPTYLRYDNVWIPQEWLNIENGNWSYKVSEIPEDEYHPDSFVFTADGKDITIPKANTQFNLGLFKISPSFTYSKTQLINNMVNVPVQVTFDGVTYPANTLAYLTFPYSLSQVKDYADEHNIKLGRWRFQAGKEHIEIHDDVIVEHVTEEGTYQAVSTLDKQFYAFKIVNGEIRIYFVKSEANKLNGNITFQLNSWTVGEGGNAWSGFATFNNFMLDRNTNHIILPDAVTDGLVLYHKMSGSSGTTSYDMNLTSNNNGTLTNMNTGLDNGTSGWNSTQCKYGNCINFDGLNDYVHIENSFDSNVGTLSLWFESRNVSTNPKLIYTGSPSTGYIQYYTGTWKYYSPGNVLTVNWGKPPLNTKHYLTLVVNGTHHFAYLDGVLVGSPVASTNDIFLNSTYFRLSDTFNGLIDDVRIYNRAFTNDEINQTMVNSMSTFDTLTTSHDAGAGYETYQIDINATAQTNSNYSAFYRTNGTGSWTAIGTANSTGNQSITLTTTYQNTDLKIELYGNGTATPEIIKTTFWTGTIPIITLLDYYGITSNGTKITVFDTDNLSAIEKLQLNFSITSMLNISDWYFNFTANGTRGCSLGNKQSSKCYNYSNAEPYKWIKFINGSETTTFDGTNMNTGDYIQVVETTTGTNKTINLTIDEHYNPNVFKWYDAHYDFDDVKWQSGVNQRITKNQLIKVTINQSIVPMDADQYKLDFRVNYSQPPKEPTHRIRAFACSHNYTTGDPDASPHCAIVGAKYPSELQDDGTKFRAIFTKNLIDQIGDIDYIILATAEPNPTQYYYIKTYKATAPAYTTHWEYSDDLGTTWANLGDGYETELNINWFYDGLLSDTITSFVYQMYANGSLSSNTTLGEIAWSIDATNNYPPLVNIMAPVADEAIYIPYNITFDAVDTNNDVLNVSLYLYQNGSLYQTLITNMTAANKSFIMTSIPIGTYQLVLWANETNTTEYYNVSSTRNITVAGVSDLTLSGYVTNNLGVYLQNARVDFDNKYDLTDAAGFYEFVDVSDKEYSILARAIGYNNYTDTFTVVSNTTKNMTLNERKPSTISMPGFGAISGLFILAVTIIFINRRTKH